MSTKIYNGWRWRKKHGLFPVLTKVKRLSEKVIIDEIREMAVRAGLHKVTPYERFSIANLLAKHTQIVRDQVSPWDYNRKFYIRDARSFYLMMPWHDREDYEYMKKITELEEFAYWNNTDMPEGMDRRRWEARRRFWTKYWFEAKSHSAVVTLSVIDEISPINFMFDALIPDAFGKKLPEDFWTKIEKRLEKRKTLKRK